MYTKREKSEWSNYWWDNATCGGNRVLLVGDSISCGYHRNCIEKLDGVFNVDLLGTSKFIADEAFLKEFAYFINEYEYNVIHFNNGLHGIDLSNDDYSSSYEKIIELALLKCKNIILATSTPITIGDETKDIDPIKNDVVIARNKIVQDIAKKLNLQVNDLYHKVLNNKDIKTTDGYHYTQAGYDFISDFVVEKIKNFSK